MECIVYVLISPPHSVSFRLCKSWDGVGRALYMWLLVSADRVSLLVSVSSEHLPLCFSVSRY